jgi:para-nitrobenzyl esterase
MRNAFVLIVILASIAAAPGRAAFEKPVRVTGGLVSGVSGRDPSVTVFKGLPFAAPPVGDLRWRAPKPVVAWQGVRKADTFGSSCVQSIADERKPWTYEFMAHTDVSEDCLFLNVWTAAKSPTEKRPVYVYVHGGANTEGSGAVPVYDGEGLARKGIVVVTVNYRLGVLGFFTHPELTKESEAHASGNYALLDVIAALRWVQESIGAFGGDPANVTLGGQSAGASNTHSLTASPLARGLFHRAIAESGSTVAAGAGTRSLSEQEQLGVTFAEAKGARSLADLRGLSWKDLSAPVTAPASANGPAPNFRFGVVIDGYVLPASVADVFASGKQNDVPTLTGANKHEGGATPHPEITADAFQKQARQRFGDLADEFLALYPSATDEQARLVQNESSWDQARVSMYLWAMNRARTAKTKAYTYFWDHPLPGPDVEKYGAFHTSEVPYVMNALAMSNRPFTDQDRRIADTLSSYWANFIKTGDPNGPGLPNWPAVAKAPAMTMEIGDKNAPIPVAGLPGRLAFFEKFFGRQRPAGTR